MHYQIREIEIPFETGKIIEFKALSLCKILEVCCRIEESKESFVWYVRVLERWGGEKPPIKTHKILILQVGQQFDYTVSYEPVLHRRGRFEFNGETHYVFSL